MTSPTNGEDCFLESWRQTYIRGSDDTLGSSSTTTDPSSRTDLSTVLAKKEGKTSHTASSSGGGGALGLFRRKHQSKDPQATIALESVKSGDKCTDVSIATKKKGIVSCFIFCII